MKFTTISNPETTITDLISIYNEKRFRYLYVLNFDGALVGVISQGDLLSAISKLDHYKTIYDVMQHNFINITDIKQINKKMLKLLKNNHIDEIPIVDKQGHLIDVFSIFDLL